MSSTDSASAITDAVQYYVVCALSAALSLISVIISLFIVIIVRRTKPRLHTVRHLLMCNTCFASIFYCITQTINFMFLIFLPWETSDEGCRWRGYLGYMSIAASIYSYLIQAISRFFFSTYSNKYNWLTTFKTHYILIALQWLLVILIASPAIITNDIYFRPGLLCWVPFKQTLHVAYTVFAYYLVPVLLIIIIYIHIYRRVRKARKHAQTVLKMNNDKRDLEVLRNVLILVTIYITGGIPTIIFLLSGLDIFYVMGLVTFILTVTIEKLCAMVLDRELRQTIKEMMFKKNRIVPFQSTTSLKLGDGRTRF